MQPSSATVECYAGYRAAESPVAFIVSGVRHLVNDIVRRTRSPETESFVVETPSGERWTLCHWLADENWTAARR